MSTLRVDAIRHNSATSDAITMASDGTCTAKITSVNGGSQLSHRNIIVNGAMTIAQRAASSTSTGYQTVDRFAVNFSGTDEAPTQAQVTLSSSDTPYSSGFRYALKITNGNQTSGGGAADYVQIVQKIEAQDMAGSGWNYTSSSSNITLSFWVKSSVAQTMYARLNAEDASRAFSFAFSATTSWTKIIKTIPGDSNLVFNNDNGIGIALYFIPFYGTNYTTSGHSNDSWIADSSSNQVTDMTTTWYTTNDATFEITGVQLEVGPQATPFEPRPYTEEFKLCQRYYQDWQDWTHPAHRGLDSNYDGHIIIDTLRIDMRTNPTITQTSYGWIADGNSWTDGSNSEAASLHHDPSSDYLGRYVKVTGAHNWDSNYNNTIAVKFVTAKFDAEL